MRHADDQVNIASLRSALNSMGMAGLVARLEEMKLPLDRRLGLVWRLQAQEGQNFTKRAQPSGRSRQVTSQVSMREEAANILSARVANHPLSSFPVFPATEGLQRAIDWSRFCHAR